MRYLINTANRFKILVGVMDNMNSDVFYSTISTASLKSLPLSNLELSIINKGYRLEGCQKVYEFAHKEKIIPFIAHLLSRLNIDTEFWYEIHESYAKRNEEIINLLDEIFYSFKTKGIDKLFVYENFGALLASNSCIGCFASGDVDLYAQFAQKETIEAVLKEKGFYPLTTNTPADTVKTEYYNPELFESGFRLNIMWKLMSRTRLPFPLNLDTCMNWQDLKSYKGTHINLPSNEILMYLCLLHVSIHSFIRSPGIRLYIDLDRMNLVNPDWEKITNYAIKDGTEVRIATAALISSNLLEITLSKQITAIIRKRHRRINCLLSLLYDRKNNRLKRNPSVLSILLLEILSADVNLMKSICQVIFPSKEWIKEYYLPTGGFLLKGYLKHIKNLL